MNRIVYGTLEFNHRNLIDGTCNLQHAMNGESLAIDSLTFKAWTGQEPQGFILSDTNKFKTSDGYILQVLTDNIDPTVLTIGTPLMYYFDNVLIGKFYIDEIIRNGNDTYTFRCISSVGILERTRHYGGIYTGQTVKSVLLDLLTGIDYELDDSVEDLRLYGYLPYDTRRNNLQQITVATGLAVRLMPNGKILITALSKDKISTIGNSKAIVGGSYNRLVPATNIILTEHKYETSTEEIQLFNEGLNGSTTVIFNEPMHSLVVTGGTITASGANYATINGAGTVTLTGKKYIHTTKELVYGGGNGTNKVKVGNATLVTMINSEDVIKRLYDIYVLDKVVEQEFIYEGERTGDMVNVINPYTYEINSACVKSLDITFGGFLKAKGKFLVDFVPSQPTMGYATRIVLTSGSNWTVPAGVNKLRVILIGGGSGGAGGTDGKNGSYYEGTSLKKGGAGGIGGTGGDSGKVLNTTLNVTPGQNIAYAIGLGGTGGPKATAGNAGSNTIFSSLSSANGSNIGEYVDIYTGERFAQNGKKGFDGGKGSSDTELGNEVNGFKPGANGQTDSLKIGSRYIYGIGGGGGGASDIADGYPGTDGDCSYNNGNGFADGGNGGNGANGGNGTNAIVYGSGGNGGSGGGGGGYKGEGHGTSSSYEWDGQDGVGGLGGAGGKGANGCIIIYY